MKNNTPDEDVKWKKTVLILKNMNLGTLLPCRANLMAELDPTSEGSWQYPGHHHQQLGTILLC